MPLSPSVDRAPVHTRNITCSSYVREDGMWDIEGQLTDVKAYSFVNDFRGEVHPGEPIHDMKMRLTVDSDICIHSIEAVIDSGPYQACPAITPAFSSLEGEKIGPGWNRLVREKLGGVHGCNHLVDMLGPMATVAFHTVRWSDTPSSTDNLGAGNLPINACHIWSATGDMVREQLPDFYTGDTPD